MISFALTLTNTTPPMNTTNTPATHTANVQMWDDTRVRMDLPAKVTIEPRHYSATGYGAKIPTRYMVRFGPRWRRVYMAQFGNAGTAYIGKPGAWLAVVDAVDPA